MPTPALPPDNLAAAVAEYARLRPVTVRLHNIAARMAGKEAVRACARRLQMLSRRDGRSRRRRPTGRAGVACAP